MAPSGRQRARWDRALAEKLRLVREIAAGGLAGPHNIPLGPATRMVPPPWRRDGLSGA